MPVSIGSTRCTGAGPAPFFACVRCALAVLFVIGGSLAPVVGTVCLGRRDSHADQGAVATQFSSSTGAGTSPATAKKTLRACLQGCDELEPTGGEQQFAADLEFAALRA